MPAPDPAKQWTTLPASWREAAFERDGAVLLESSLQSESEHCSYLFTGPERILMVHSSEDLPALFKQIEDALKLGNWIAGYLSYEAGAHFADLLAGGTAGPIAVFGIYAKPRIFDHRIDAIDDATDEPDTAQPHRLSVAPMLRVLRDDYTAAIHRIQQWIAAGDTYQLNFTTHATSPYAGDAATLYEALRAQQPCSYGGIVRLQPDHTILSFSPELFFRAAPDGTLTTKPMKGTAARGATPEEDEARSQALRNDEKNRAEHVMIVDLLRNDLGRICTAGSVEVQRLFEVERYPTLLQMTSTITGRMPTNLPWYEVFRALFPSGSITGAPKRHTMELIAELEARPRGVYTGAIGYFAPDRSGCFNVAIRTAVLDGKTMELGVGGGIVADSTADSEYDECLLKTAFLQRASRSFDLIETMRADNGRIALLDRHLHRLAISARALGFAFDEQSLRSTITGTLDGQRLRQRVRLVLCTDGECRVELADLPAWRADVKLCIAVAPLQSDAPHLRYKTTFRPDYAPAFAAAQAAGWDEAIFENERGDIADGCISSLLVCLGGQWVTPSRTSGCLPGVYRGALLDAGLIAERTLTLEDLHAAEHVCVCNAVRGVGCVASLQLADGDSIHYKIAARPPQVPA